MPTLLKLAAAAAVIAMFAPSQMASQQPEPGATPTESEKQKRPVKFDPWFSVEAEFDDNVFLLRPSRKRAVDAPSSADIASGRFVGMESAADLVVQESAGVDIEMTGLGGRDLTLAPAVRYEDYTRNDERSHLTASAALSQALARGMRTRLEAAYTLSRFRKNSLADAADANGDGSIGPEERSYAPAAYSAGDVELAHRFRLRKSTKRSRLGLELDLAAGYYARSYDAPFAGRDLSGPRFRSTLGIEPGRRAAFTLEYVLEALSADAGEEVLIMDEAEAGRDLNANGTATDPDVRTVQLVDRSRRHHELRAGARFDVARRTDLRIRYGLRFRGYTSEQPLDIAHRDRRDTRHELRGEFLTRVARGVRLNAGARFARQTSNRLFDPDQTDEADDYSRMRAFAGLRLDL